MPLDGEMRGEISFDLKTPCTDDQLAANVALALKRGLPQTQARKRLVVVANGPSAKQAPFDTDLPTLALNGALRQFTERGLAPTYWAACDPQALVADFLKDAPEETTYLVASKCNPLVFDMLADRKVMVWNVADTDIPDHVRAPLCCSITMTAMWEMRHAFGFTDLDVYGWDASFMDNEHHAGDDAGDYRSRPDFVTINYGGEIVGDEVIGGRNFETTHSWAAEADFAQQFFQLARYHDMNVTLHGDGMMVAIQSAVLANT